MNLSDYFPYRLAVVAEEVSHRIARVYRSAHSLSRQEWRIMAVLGEDAEVVASALRDLTTMDKSSVSRALRALETKRLIKRTVSECDRRELFVSLTEHGRAVHAAVLPQAIREANTLLDGFSSDEKILFLGFLDRLERRLKAG